MIRFLRQIRFDFLNRKQSFKYIIYVLGDIFLVVIGILIALQVNNWNEAQKESKQEKVILEKLATDLERNVSALEFCIDYDNDNVRRLDIILHHLKIDFHIQIL